MDDTVEGCQATYPPIARMYVPGLLYEIIKGYEVPINDETRRIVDVKQNFDGRRFPCVPYPGVIIIAYYHRILQTLGLEFDCHRGDIWLCLQTCKKERITC